jgi:predicted XRE-type DNA-binding protein
MKFVEVDNVFEALGSNKAEAHTHRLRSDLMMTVEDIITEKKLSPEEAAKNFGVSLETINDLLTGKWRSFTIDELIAMLARVDVLVELSIPTKIAA